MLHALAALAITVLPAQPDEEMLFEGTGSHSRKVATKNPLAQTYFDQGLNFMFAFNHGEAKRLFRSAAKRDPGCAMAWWGLAMANGPHINNMAVAPEEELEAVESLKRALSVMGDEPAADQALIRAALVRFQHPPAKDRGPLNRAFAGEMRTVWRRFPRDADVGALFAESMMDLRPWDLWTRDYKPKPGTLEVVATLERVNTLNPKHPLGLHLYVHAVEASSTPERARDEADRLRTAQPGLGHNVHMPTHIDVRLGEWQKAIDWNAKAMAADRSYREKRPDQFIYRIYMAHNNHMLAFGAMMLGQGDLATKALDEMVAVMPEDFKTQAGPFIDGFIAMPIEVRKRFGKWDEILAMPDLPGHFPLARSMRFAARCVAYSAKGMPGEARAEQAAFYEARSKVPADGLFGQNKARHIALVATQLMNGELLIAEGKFERAVAELRMAVAEEDRLKYSEPPDWIQPCRHTLGALLTKLGRHKEAVAVYREDLRRLPNNGWSLFGLSASLRALGMNAESVVARRKFNEVWANADVAISSSCLCIEGK